VPTTLVSKKSRHRMLPASGEAQGVARGIVESMSRVAEYPDLLFAGQLLASELAGNAVRHAAPATAESILLVVECDGDTLHLEVVDDGPGFEPLGMLVRHERSNEPYHGIVLVNALSDRWGFRRADEGMCVWFELDLVPGRRPWRGRDPVHVRRPGA
jgi:anti-sigma regulatory factor (Ser/Thr protein kinase)